ncbi:MAG: hypothetical protein H7Z43_04835 [Clostridia bacterium]|nr:hypothetical protein [Deltaproteobacteria bacterium]
MKIAVIAAALVCLGTTYAHAGDHACKTDVEKFCKDIKSGEGRIHDCMKSHEAEISTACKADITQRATHNKEITEACKDDREKLCTGIEPGHGRISACFEDNAAKLSTGCKAKLATRGKHWKEARKACAADIKTNCPGVRGGHGAKLQCIHEHADALSPACKDAIDDVE